MTAIVAPAGAARGLELLAEWRGLIAAFRSEVVVTEEVRVATAPAVEAGARLLSSASLDDFHERLDALALDPTLFWTIAGVVRAVEDVPKIGAVAIDGAAPLEDVLGRGQRDLLWRADRMVRCLGLLTNIFFGQMLRAAGVKLPAASSLLADTTPSDLIYDSAVAPEVRLATLAALKTNALIFACVALKLRPTKVEPWLQRAIADSLVDSLQSSLALYAALTHHDVPEDLLPAAARLELQPIFERNAKANLALDRLQRDAQGAAGDLYPAVALPDD